MHYVTMQMQKMYATKNKTKKKQNQKPKLLKSFPTKRENKLADLMIFLVTPLTVGVELLELGDHKGKFVVVQGIYLLLRN